MEYAAGPSRTPATIHDAFVASFGQRFWARFADVLLTAPIVALQFAVRIRPPRTCYLFHAVKPPASVCHPALTTTGKLLAVASTLAFMAYEVGCIARWGQTIGKRLLRTRVVTWTNGTVPSPRQAFVRWGIPSVFGMGTIASVFDLRPGLIATLLPLLVYVWMFTNPYRRGLHDLAAGTVVVSVRPAEPRPRTDRRA